MPKKVRYEQRYLSDEEQELFLEVAKEYYHYDIFCANLSLGARIGEVLGLKWSDIDFEKKTIHIQRTLHYAKVKDAMCLVDLKGYGVVIPKRDEIELENPTVIKNGNKYGIKIKAKAPSIHLIKADVSTEIAPIVGSEEQAKDLLSFISKNQDSEEGIWDTNIFGKTIEQIVYDGISMKIDRLSDETRYKMQDTISKITNESKGGVICIII